MWFTAFTYYCGIWQSNSTHEASAAKVDQYISAELPDPIFDSLGFSLVQEFMIHGPCVPVLAKSPFMKTIYVPRDILSHCSLRQLLI